MKEIPIMKKAMVDEKIANKLLNKKKRRAEKLLDKEENKGGIEFTK